MADKTYALTFDFSDGSKQTVQFISPQGEQGPTGASGFDGKDYSFDPTVYGLPVLYLKGDVSPIAVSKDNKVTMTYVYGTYSGSCTLKGQGATSYKTAQALGKFGKFNYTIKLDQAIEVVSGWGKQKKYCLKANFIDPTHSRNIVSCRLWGLTLKSRSNVPAEFANLPNGGAIDGFPVIIMLNDEFHGLYTWNIPKDGWMFGLVEDTSKTQAIVCANDHTTATQFKGELAGNWSDFELEFVSDEASTDWVAASLNRLLNACVNSNGSNLDTTLSQYLDWTSAIDYFIHTVVDKATDCVDKNYLLVTLDGTKWYFSVYDRDSIHGLAWDGSTLSRPVSNVNFSECASTNRVFELIYRFKTNELKSRYNALRLGELSESRIMQYFENFAWAIPSPVMLEDVKRWPSIPGSSVNTIDQIGRFVRQRLTQVDEWIASLPAQETPEAGEESSGYAVTNKLTGCKTTNSANTVEVGAPYTASITANSGYSLDGASVVITMGGTDVTSAYSGGTISIDSVTGTLVISITAVASVGVYTNQVPLSTDTDGSIYNGVGYKDNVRLSSSGSISGTAQTGSVTTGLIPIAFGDIIRMKGATWLGLTVSDGHYYIMFYDSNKTKLDGYACYTVDSSYAGVSVEYDEATGVTTWDTSKGTSGLLGNMPSVAYFRLNALGFGKDLIITVNEEIA